MTQNKRDGNGAAQTMDAVLAAVNRVSAEEDLPTSETLAGVVGAMARLLVGVAAFCHADLDALVALTCDRLRARTASLAADPAMQAKIREIREGGLDA